jgi:hypothetical protein
VKNEKSIVIKEELSEDECRMAKMYWDIDKRDRRLFKYTVRELAEKFETTPTNLTRQVKNNSILLSSEPEHVCSKCFHFLEISSRAIYLNYFGKGKVELCDECIEAEKKEILEKQERIKQELLQRTKDELESIQNSLECCGYELEELSLVDGVYLIIWYRDYRVIYNDKLTGLQSLNEYRSITGNERLEIEIQHRLTNSGLIYNHKFKTHHHSVDCTSFINTINEVDNDLGIIRKVFERVSSKSISLEDFIMLKEILTRIRVEQLYKLLVGIEKYHKITVQKNMKMELLMEHIAGIYSLEKCYYLLNYCAEKVAAEIYRNDPPYHIQQHLLYNKLSGYLELVKKNNWKIEFKKSVVGIIDNSPFEAYLCDRFTPDEFNWFSLDLKQILGFVEVT